MQPTPCFFSEFGASVGLLVSKNQKQGPSHFSGFQRDCPQPRGGSRTPAAPGEGSSTSCWPAPQPRTLGFPKLTGVSAPGSLEDALEWSQSSPHGTLSFLWKAQREEQGFQRKLSVGRMGRHPFGLGWCRHSKIKASMSEQKPQCRAEDMEGAEGLERGLGILKSPRRRVTRLAVGRTGDSRQRL